MQPLHAVTDIRFAEKRIGVENLQYTYAWNSLFEAGLKIAMEKAIALYTLGLSYAEFMEDRKGKLVNGYLADLVMFNQNLLTIPHEQILNTKVDYTIVGGNIVCDRIKRNKYRKLINSTKW